MDNGGLRELIFQVVSSWQVIGATVLIFFYFFLVNYASRSHYHRRPAPSAKPKRVKKAKVKAEEAVDDSELGLED